MLFVIPVLMLTTPFAFKEKVYVINQKDDIPNGVLNETTENSWLYENYFKFDLLGILQDSSVSQTVKLTKIEEYEKIFGISKYVYYQRLDQLDW